MEGLGRLRDTAISVCSNTSKPQPLRDEACGIIGLVDTLKTLEAEIVAFRRLATEEDESK